MQENRSIYQGEWSALALWWSDYKQLVKFRLNLTVVLSSVLAYFVAAGAESSLREVILLTLGGFLVTGASNILNQVLEKDYDALMKRTTNRPLPQGRVSISQAVMRAGWMSALGITLLAMLNPWAGFLGALSLILYAFVYTPVKRLSPLAVPIGAVPGAMPALIGCVAFQDMITPLGLLLFGLMFFWQFPHFYAIAELAKEDYRKAGFKIIADDADAGDLGMQSLWQATLLLPIVAGLFYWGHIGVLEGLLMVMMTLVYMWLSYQFSQQQTRKSALVLMFSSFFYLPLFMLVMVIGHFA